MAKEQTHVRARFAFAEDCGCADVAMPVLPQIFQSATLGCAPGFPRRPVLEGGQRRELVVLHAPVLVEPCSEILRNLQCQGCEAPIVIVPAPAQPLFSKNIVFLNQKNMKKMFSLGFFAWLFETVSSEVISPTSPCRINHGFQKHTHITTL